MKILLSGGWGYGNLGDDAILTATIKLLKREHPHASITVMTYDCDATRRAVADLGVDVTPSIHRYLTGKLSLTRFGTLCNKSSLPTFDTARFAQRVRAKLRSKAIRQYICLAEELSYHKYCWLSRNHQAIPTYQEFQSADLFVMSGGAYLNSMWPDSVYAHGLELMIAHGLGLKSVLVGQSIGPFHTERAKTVALQALRLAAQVSVRDGRSYHDLRREGIECCISPDIALSEVDFDFDKLPEIATIVNNDLTDEAQEQVHQAIVRFCDDQPLRVKVLVTRLWWPDAKRATMFYDTLKANDLDVTLILPDSYMILQREIGGSQVVLSPNLHGLILGWRAGVPAVSLQRHGKYIAFMEHTHQEQRAFASHQLDAAHLVSAMHDALQTSCGFRQERGTISKEVASQFSAMLAV